MELNDIIAGVNIEEYIANYIDLTQKNDELIGVCPFHNEKTPSFTVTPSKQLFYCFGCGSGGNILTFIQKYHKMELTGAIDRLKKYANVDDSTYEAPLEIVKLMKRYACGKQDATCVDRGCLHKDVMNPYEFNLQKLEPWITEGISPSVLEKFQVRYDRNSNRIVYPIWDADGNIASVKGRTLDPDFKERGIRKYTYFHKIQSTNFLYGYHQHLEDIKKCGEVIIFEGEKSVMLCESWGIQNTLAIMTSHLNPFQLPLLIKLGVRVVFALDANIDISTDTNINKLKRFVRVEVVSNEGNVLEPTEAPIDKGLNVWMSLYNQRRMIN